MNKRFGLLFFILLTILLSLFLFNQNNSFSYTLETNSVENIYKLKDSDAICREIRNNDAFTINIYSSYGFTSDEINGFLNTLDNPEITSLEKIGIIRIDDHNYRLKSPSGACSNGTYRDKWLKPSDVVKGIEKGEDYPPWSFFGRMDKSTEVYIDDVLVKSSSTNEGKYSFFRVSNTSRAYSEENNKLLWTQTLKPGEKTYFLLDVTKFDNSDNASATVIKKMNSSNDLRLTMKLGADGSNISLFKSLAYYIYTSDNTEYGPYEPEYVSIAEQLSSKTNNKLNKILVYNVISENLFDSIPENTEISKIKIIPSEYYPIEKSGEFRIYSLSIDKYQNHFVNNIEYTELLDAESVIRHKIINNRLETGLIKWYGSDNPNKSMRVYYSSSRPFKDLKYDKVFYGLPYVTVKVVSTTLYSFLDQLTYNEQTNTYAYHISETYKKDTESMRGYPINETPPAVTTHLADELTPDNIYLINTSGSIEKLMQDFRNSKHNANHYNDELDDSSKEFITNSNIYLQGNSCSTGALEPLAREIPTLSYISSYNYFYSNEVEMIGNLKLDAKEVENALRCKETAKYNDKTTQIFNKEKFVTEKNFNHYYSSVMKLKYSSQTIYNAYGLIIPGDLVVHSGHVRTATGYSNVVCNDGTVYNKGTYTNFACQNHGGINPTKSYMIGTGNYSKTERRILEEDTGWEYTLNSKYTDLTSINDLENVVDYAYISLGPTMAFTFSELYMGAEDPDEPLDEPLEDLNNSPENSSNVDEEPTNECEGDSCNIIINQDSCPRYLEDKIIEKQTPMYLPFRFKKMSQLSNNKIETQNIELFLDKEYSNEEMFDWIKTNKKLKGTIISNYLIDGIKIEINDEKYYIYPTQRRVFSLYDNLENEISNVVKNTDFSKTVKIKVSVKSGPELNAIKQSFGDTIDDEYYITILEVRSPQVNYYQGNGTGNAGTTRFSKITECASGDICQLASYKNLTSNSFPHSDNGWSFAGYSTSIDGTNIDYTGGESITYNGTNDLDLYVVGVRNFKFSSGISPTSNSGNIPQYWNPYKIGTDYVTTINVPVATPIESWTFIGYRANNSASSTITIKNPGSYQPPSNSLTSFEFRAIYKRDVTVNFNSNGGTGSMDSITKVQYYNSGFGKNNQNNGANITNVSFVLPENTFTKKGCIFKGWGENNNSSSTLPEGYEYTSFNPSVNNQSTTKTLYAIWEKDFDYEIKKYPVDNEYINKIKINTTLEEFKKNITINSKYSLIVNNMLVNNKNILFTGGKTKIYNGNTIYKEFTNVVSGDINGDALINSADLLKIKLHLLNKSILTKAYYLAADVNHDNTINSADLLKIRQHLLGKFVIE